MVIHGSRGGLSCTPATPRSPCVVPLSTSIFFDPSFDAVVPTPADFVDDHVPRWDGQSVATHEGTYDDYLVRRVSQVFPALRDEVLSD